MGQFTYLVLVYWLREPARRAKVRYRNRQRRVARHSNLYLQKFARQNHEAAQNASSLRRSTRQRVAVGYNVQVAFAKACAELVRSGFDALYSSYGRRVTPPSAKRSPRAKRATPVR
jgi:hypothetical protein